MGLPSENSFELDSTFHPEKVSKSLRFCAKFGISVLEDSKTIARVVPLYCFKESTPCPICRAENARGLAIDSSSQQPLVNRDPPTLRSYGGAGSATRRARRLGVESDVGELSFVFEKGSYPRRCASVKFLGTMRAMVGV